MSENCWHCGTPAAGSPFCKFCNHLQEPVPDYYDFFGIERRLSLDPGELQKRFYKMSRLFHPDHYQRASPRDQKYALEATAMLNDAYRVLRDPVSRAEYLLKEEGDAGKGQNIPPELLEKVFELNEALEDTSARPQLEAAIKRFSTLQAEADRELEELFRRYDTTHDRTLLSEVRTALNRRKYISNLLSQVEAQID
jgi:molecular chaperone HscB